MFFGVTASNVGPLAAVSAVAYRSLLCACGDSITKGQAGVTGQPDTEGATYHDLYAQSDPTGLLTHANRAVGGWGLASVISDAAATDALLAENPNAEIKLLSVMIGRNDGLYPANDDSYNGGASWIEQFKTYLNARRAAGWNKIVVGTITPYNTSQWEFEGNDRIRALVGSGHADAVIDFGADPVMGTWSATYYQDYVHPNLAGQYKMYGIAAPVYDSILEFNGVKTSTPYFSPQEDNFVSAQSVTIRSKTSGTTIHYTTDGSTPTTSSDTYSTPISVSATTTIKAIAVKSGLTNSSVNSALYNFGSPLVWNIPDLPTGTSLSESNRLLSVTSADSTKFIRGAIPLSGKKIVELEIVTNGYAAVYTSFGFLKTSVAIGSNVNANVLGWARVTIFGQITTDGVLVALPGGATSQIADGYPDKLVAGDRMLFAFDMNTGKAWHRKKNGAVGWTTLSAPASNPETGAEPHWTFDPSGSWYFAATMHNSTGPNLRLPTTDLVTPPSGFTLLNG